MKLIVKCVFLIVLLQFLNGIDLYSQMNNKKKATNHSLELGIGHLNITTDALGDAHNPGLNYFIGYTHTEGALMYGGKLSYTSFPKYDEDDVKSEIQDISLLFGVFWNILERDFYEGITPYIGIEGGYTMFLQELDEPNYSFSGGYTFSNIGPVVGTTIPLHDILAFVIEARYKITWVNVESRDFSTGTSNSVSTFTDYNYYLLNAGLRIGID